MLQDAILYGRRTPQCGYRMGDVNSGDAADTRVERHHGKIKGLINTAWEMVTSDTEAAYVVISEARQLCEANRYEAGLNECLLLEARYDGEMDRYFDALQKANEAYRIYVNCADLRGQIRACRVLGYLFSRHGKYNSALEHIFLALKLLKESNCSVTEGLYPIEVFLMNNVAFIYAETGRDKEALNFFMKAYELTRGVGGSMVCTTLTNIAEMHLNTGDARMALRYNRMAMKEIKQQKLGYQDLHNCYNSFGLIYQKIGRYREAMESFTNSLEAAKNGESKYNEIVSRLAIARLNLQTQDIKAAIDILTPAYSLADEIKANVLLKDICLTMAQTCEYSGDMESALRYFKKHVELNNAICSRELEQRMSDYSAEFKAEQAIKDAEIYRLKNIELKQKSDELEESNRNIQFISDIGRKITSSLDIEKVLFTIQDSIVKLMNVNVFAIGLYDDAGETVTFRMVVENSVRLSGFQKSVLEGDGYLHKCIRNRSEIVVDDLLALESEAASADQIVTNGETPRSFIFSPLIYAGAVVGVITVQSYQPNAYTRTNVETIRALGSYIAVALNNSRQSEELHKKAKELEVLSRTDPLTGLYNRRFIIEKMEEERTRFRRYGKPFSLVIVDIDFFKRVNDAWGHDCGDFVLVEAARHIKRMLREQDCLARWGGEEFLLLLPETDSAGAEMLADRLRASMEERVFEYRKKQISITLTMGISEYGECLTVDDAIMKADNALYEGKNRGRNCVVVNF